MQRQTTVSLWCERIIESGWLLALALIPIYFNLLSARHFEPDKATTLRSLVLIMAAFALIRVLEKINLKDSATSQDTSEPMSTTNPLGQLWKRFSRIPMAVPVLFYAIVFIIATIPSVVPHTSFWGSYQRLQGTYTNLSYILLFALIVIHLRERAQLERAITVILITGLMVSFYGVVQHSGFDPLPWRGDVQRRVASTMGNAIFVAAYLIMVVPLALYRIAHGASEIRGARHSNNPLIDILWALAYAIMIAGTMLLLVSAIKFGSSVQAADFRYWWVFPGAVVVSTSLWVLPALDLQHRERRPGFFIWPGALFGMYALFLALLYMVTESGGKHQVTETDGLSWGIWLLISTGLIIVFYVIAFVLPRTAGTPSRMNWGLRIGGYTAVLLSMLLTIFYSQSRGPWLGLSAGLFVFLTLTLWLSGRRASQKNKTSGLAQGLRFALWGWGLLSIAGVIFIAVFNFSDAPFFNELRKIPYLGRAGTLFESSAGTGRVRSLIWAGDEHAGGSIGLITADPMRTVIGWGPESMFVAFNPYYPPSLANIEARTASPDRAHQAILDELITKGFLGLISYLFVLISFVVLCWQIIQKSTEWQWQVLAIACLSAVSAHIVEGLTGIPIVATLMMLWVTFAITILTGKFAGHYTLSAADAATPKPAPAETAQTTTDTQGQETESPEKTPKPATGQAAASTTNTGGGTQSKSSKRSKGRSSRGGTSGGGGGRRATAGSTARGAGAERKAQTPVTARVKTAPAALAFYAFILVLTLGAVWKFNISPVYADMRFHEGESLSNMPNAGLNVKIFGLHKYLDAIRHNPKEDFYYLNLGRSLMELAEAKRSAGEAMGEEDPQVTVEQLLEYETEQEVGGFVQAHSPMELMSYARAILRRAYDLNPLNKDHSANLARLNNFWYNWAQDLDKLEAAAKWYATANEVAPYDVQLINESANIQMMLGTILASNGQEEAAQQHYALAERLYTASLTYDPNFEDQNQVGADMRLAELYRQQGKMEEAAEMYVHTIKRKPHQFDQQIDTIIAAFQTHPDLLRQIRDAYEAKAKNDARLHAVAGLISVRVGDMEQAAESYEQAVELEPNNLGNRRNYTIILSDTKQYSRALAQATAALSLTQQQDGSEQEAAQLEYLIGVLEQSVARDGGTQ